MRVCRSTPGPVAPDHVDGFGMDFFLAALLTAADGVSICFSTVALSLSQDHGLSRFGAVPRHGATRALLRRLLRL